ncbi:uncharacterized protein LOC135686719 [Rhopilema esculentum]|uniref:uncharacterized protein LOC135686719 n=1 Tax=Rhopilema esculentum TaxID=499914 RepID=UPI0031E160EA
MKNHNIIRVLLLITTVLLAGSADLNDSKERKVGVEDDSPKQKTLEVSGSANLKGSKGGESSSKLITIKTLDPATSIDDLLKQQIDSTSEGSRGKTLYYGAHSWKRAGKRRRRRRSKRWGKK